MAKYWLILFFFMTTLSVLPVFSQDDGSITVETDSASASTEESFDYLEATEQSQAKPKKKFDIVAWFKKTFLTRKKPKNIEGENAKAKSEFAEKDIEELNYLFIQAAIVGDIDQLIELLKYGVNINTVNYQGRSALIEVARLGDAKTAEWLLDRGASINHKDMYDGSALLYATQRGKVNLVNLLLERGARRDFNR